jgi:hypothetical protein
VIDNENRITAIDSAEAAAATLGERFGNWSELVALAATWPAQRLASEAHIPPRHVWCGSESAW